MTRMAKQKRKVSEVTEKKKKKLKKALAEETLLAPEATPGHEETHPQGGAVCTAVPDSDPELSPEEKRVLERKRKKERKKEERQRLREAAVTTQNLPARHSGAELALAYLCGWAQKHKDWKFQKTRQTWLLLNMYDSDKVCARWAWQQRLRPGRTVLRAPRGEVEQCLPPAEPLWQRQAQLMEPPAPPCARVGHVPPVSRSTFQGSV
ncbi:protein cholesin isoform X1 [Eulemur rufifrons]|uniref:protein cholesin isoform X1 n=1 Tax=Eulemur rufifrons TaxID=859984 RepID=UPI0037435EB6